METKLIYLQNATPMKDQEIINQTQITTQQESVDLGRKMLKGIPNRVIYMAASTFKN